MEKEKDLLEPYISKLRQYSEVDILKEWTITQNGRSSKVKLDDDGAFWELGNIPSTFEQSFTIPENIKGYKTTGLSLKLWLFWQANKTDVYINDKLTQQGDLFDCNTRVHLLDNVKGGEEFTVRIEFISPDMLKGLLLKSKLIFENVNGIDPSFVADELDFVSRIGKGLFQESYKTFETEIIDIFNIGSCSNHTEIEALLRKLRRKSDIWRKPIEDRTLFMSSHSHLDLAWLWPVPETWEVAKNTFNSVLGLQDDFKELKYNHSTPALYEWIETNQPELFKKIQDKVKEGSWEVLAGFWVEPELNVISGESIARQVLLGQLYTKEKFGEVSEVAWLPDIFGFCSQLPQIMKSGGINYFVTQKLRWNDTTKFPYDMFKWESPDGTSIFSYMSAPIGEHVNPSKIADYMVEWEKKTKIKESLWLPGVGDHGGGPTRDMLNVLQRWQGKRMPSEHESPIFPKSKFTLVKDYLKYLSSYEKAVPTWKDELYLEFHRGCYTTHAKQKKFNRELENLLYEAELFCSMASFLLDAPYPEDDLQFAWKETLFNQFHDILPGTSIEEVYPDANERWSRARTLASGVKSSALTSILNHIDMSNKPEGFVKPICVFNSTPFDRSEVLTIDITSNSNIIKDHKGNPVDAVLFDSRLTFEANRVPAVGYRLYWLCYGEAKVDKPEFPNDYFLENDDLKVKISSDHGGISSIYSKSLKKEILSGVGNELEFFKDENDYWDAWNINKEYNKYKLNDSKLESIKYLECGQFRSVIEVVTSFRASQFKYCYILEKGAKHLEIKFNVDWRERHVLVKAAFPLNIKNEKASFEVPFGVIKRHTLPNDKLTEHEKAKWEVAALGWTDLTDESGKCGVSVLSDCKHGYDVGPSRVRSTLLRGPAWPDKTADLGNHEFRLGVFVHDGGSALRSTKMVSEEFNKPLIVVQNEVWKEIQPEKLLPKETSFFKLKNENLTLSAVKRSENKVDTFIVRFYEYTGQFADLDLQSKYGLKLGTRVNILENNLNNKSTRIKPWEIATFEVKKS